MKRGLITEKSLQFYCGLDDRLVEDIYCAGLTLATSQLATTDLLEHSHHPGPDFIFPKQLIGGKMSLRDFSNTLGFQSGLFFTTIRLRTQFSATLT